MTEKPYEDWPDPLEAKLYDPRRYHAAARQAAAERIEWAKAEQVRSFEESEAWLRETTGRDLPAYPMELMPPTDPEMIVALLDAIDPDGEQPHGPVPRAIYELALEVAGIACRSPSVNKGSVKALGVFDARHDAQRRAAAMTNEKRGDATADRVENWRKRDIDAATDYPKKKPSERDIVIASRIEAEYEEWKTEKENGDECTPPPGLTAKGTPPTEKTIGNALRPYRKKNAQDGTAPGQKWK